MTNWKAVVRAMDTPVAKLENPPNWWSRVLTVFIIGLAPVYFFLVVMAYQGLGNAWRTNDWDLFWPNVWNIFTTCWYPFGILLRLRQVFTTAHERDATLTARQAAIAGDDSSAPPIETPASTTSADIIVDREAALCLYRPDGGWRAIRRAGAIFCLTLGGSFLLFAIAATFMGQGIDWQVIVLFGGLSVLLIASGMVLLEQWRWWQTYVRVDDAGLRYWGHWRRPARFGWQEVQAFTTIRYQGAVNSPFRDLFALDAGSVVLAWELTTASSPAEFADHRFLCKRISECSSLRLRDLTESIEKLARDAAAERVERANMAQVPLPTVATTVLPPMEGYVPAPRPSKMRQLAAVAAVVLLLPAVLLVPVGWVAQQDESQYYASLVQRVHAEQPLYRDSFAADDGQWCLQQPNNGDSSRYVYADSSYRLSGTDKNSYVDCWRDYPYTNFAVETSVAQIGSDPQYDGAGLELRVNADTGGMLAFVVDEEGYWHLWEYDGNNWTSLDDSGYSSAIHQGAGATNRLLAIADGNQFLLYVNGQYMATETVGDAQSAGPIGVYSNDSALTACFTNFAVYPLPSLPPPLL